MSSETTDPTCTADGYTVYTATYDGHSATNRVTATGTALDHSYSFTKFVWSEDGTTAKAQYDCVREDNTVYYDAEMGSETTDPTCTADGYTTYTATYDGHSATNKVTATGTALNHDYEFKGFVWNEAGTAAQAKYECSRGDDTQLYDAEMSSATTDPTCTVDGFTTYTASYDGHSEDNVVTATGTATDHSYSFTKFVWSEDGTTAKAQYDCVREDDTVYYDAEMSSVVTDPTCLEDGYTVYTAAYDGHSDSNTVTAADTALGHDYIDHEAKAPTCNEIGWEAYQTCSRCDYTTYSEIPATGEHDFSKMIINDSYLNTPATCTGKATYFYACSFCGAKGSETFEYGEATGHKIVIEPGFEATCAEAGLTGATVCEYCGEIYNEHIVIPATGKHVDNDIDGYCDVCGAEVGESARPDACKLCGKVHKGFGGMIVGFFHRIIVFLKDILW